MVSDQSQVERARRRLRNFHQTLMPHRPPIFTAHFSPLAEMGLPCVGECALDAYPLLPASVHPGVVTGQALLDLLGDAKEKGYAIPAVNCVTSSSVNACLEAARKMDAPIIIQFSSGGSQFYAGKGLDNTDFKAAIAGAVSGAYHVRAMAEQYGVPVILHTDHCAKNLLPWLDGMLSASERYYAAHGEPLFSSHMLDLSEEVSAVCVPCRMRRQRAASFAKALGGYWEGAAEAEKRRSAAALSVAADDNAPWQRGSIMAPAYLSQLPLPSCLLPPAHSALS